MTSQIAAWSLAGAFFLLGAGALAAPAAAWGALRAFPRSRWPGRILTVVDMVWVVWLVHAMSLGSFAWLKAWLYPSLPVVIVLIACLMNDLLAPRALGGLFLLIPTPLLRAVRFHPSLWRLLIVALAYALAITGMIWLLSPFRFRHWQERLLPTASKVRLAGALCLGCAVLLALVGATALSPPGP
ncbi:MAG: hypothetical protein K9N49_10515 [Candidatus Marinimicrobia bacterium]|nr:hypothetical protein [Candidatus Neomarinimicrobiota bacterium]